LSTVLQKKNCGGVSIFLIKKSECVFKNTFCFEFEELKQEAFCLFWDWDVTNPTWRLVLKQLNTIRKVYLNGKNSTVEQLSFFHRFHTKSNQNVENVNKVKNRLARKANGPRRKGDKISCNLLFVTYLFM
jgi:hypothetical protein